jgi:hypothetical protein
VEAVVEAATISKRRPVNKKIKKNYINLHKEKMIMKWFSQVISHLRAHNLKQQMALTTKISKGRETIFNVRFYGRL